jgi:acetyltransferase-like isoleucine patch superfamily enzyme
MAASCITVGKYTYGHDNIRAVWRGKNKINIGKYCSIAANCTIFLGGDHRTDWITTYPFGHIHRKVFTNFNGEGHPSTKGDVNIGNDVWIGSSVTIMSGVTIGDGAVVAANSHIVKDVPPYAIVGGNPGRVLKYRFDEHQIEQLLQIQWWNWTDVKINENLPLLCSGDIDNFIKLHI